MKIKLLLVVFLFAGSVFGQQRLITGTVKSNTGDLLPAVTVSVAGTKFMEITDENGEYKISVPKGSETRRFSLLGYEGRQLTIGRDYTVIVVLKNVSHAVDEVVVICYGSVALKASIGSLFLVD